MKFHAIKIICLALCFFSSNSYAAENTLLTAEELAKTYMTAFFEGNTKLSFSLLDPIVLAKQKESLVVAYKKSIKEGNRNNFVKQFGNIDDFDEFLQLPPDQLFAVLSEKNREKSSGMALELMRKASVSVLSSSLLNNGNAQVDLEIKNLKPDGSVFRQPATLILSNQNGKWFILRDAN